MRISGIGHQNYNKSNLHFKGSAQLSKKLQDTVSKLSKEEAEALVQLAQNRIKQVNGKTSFWKKLADFFTVDQETIDSPWFQEHIYDCTNGM